MRIAKNNEDCFFRPVIHAMKNKYFQYTDTLCIEFRPAEVVESRNLDENTMIDLDRDGDICGITIEHARQRAEIPRFSFEQMPA